MNVEEALESLEETVSHPGFIYLTANPSVSWQLFISHCTLIEAAGGLVKNEKDEYLIIFRKGKYDLPKGKLDFDETPEQAAVREVGEECGITGIEIVSPLEKSFHTYIHKKKRMLKKTHWFLMDAQSQVLTPQLEEDIENAAWMTIDQIKNTVLQNTYGSIADVLRSSLHF